MVEILSKFKTGKMLGLDYQFMRMWICKPFLFNNQMRALTIIFSITKFRFTLQKSSKNKPYLRQNLLWISNIRWEKVSTTYREKGAVTACGHSPHQCGFGTPWWPIEKNTLWMRQAHPSKGLRKFHRPLNTLSTHKKRNETLSNETRGHRQSIKLLSLLFPLVVQTLIWNQRILISRNAPLVKVCSQTER